MNILAMGGFGTVLDLVPDADGVERTLYDYDKDIEEKKDANSKETNVEHVDVVTSCDDCDDLSGNFLIRDIHRKNTEKSSQSSHTIQSGLLNTIRTDVLSILRRINPDEYVFSSLEALEDYVITELHESFCHPLDRAEESVQKLRDDPDVQNEFYEKFAILKRGEK